MTTQAVGVSIQRIPLDQIVPSKHNPRKNIDKEDLAELAASIKQDGVIVPALLRPTDGTKLEIVYGERRWRASQLAGLSDLPAQVREMSDEEAAMERFVENAQREDLSPLEEANGYNDLIGKKRTVGEIAARTGKDVAHVTKMLKLLSMIPEAQKALESDKIQLGHALEISRLKPEDQKRVLKWVQDTGNQVRMGNEWVDAKTVITVESLKKFIQNNLLVELGNARFDLKDATLDKKMGACTNCPQNTANQGALFSDLKSAKCLQPECFFGKQNEDLNRKLAAMAEERGVKHVFRLAIGGSQHDNKGLGSTPVDGYYQSYRTDIVLVPAGKECDSTQPAVVVWIDEDHHVRAGEQKYKIGDETNVCVDAKCKKHHHSDDGSLRSQAGPRKGLALVNHKEGTLASSRKQRTRNEAFKQIVEKALKDDSFPKALATKLAIVVPYVKDHLYRDRWRDAGKVLGIEKPAAKQYGGPNWELAIKKMFEGKDWPFVLCTVMAEDLPADRYAPKSGALEAMASFYKVDLAEISRELQSQDRELIKGMRARAEAKAKAEKKPKKEKKTEAAKPKRGTCQFCQCTMTAPCMPPCAWADRTQTLCDAPDCLAKAKAAGLLKKPKAKAKKEKKARKAKKGNYIVNSLGGIK
jgi:ParB/RepB/Spo0J family partition protein